MSYVLGIIKYKRFWYHKWFFLCYYLTFITIIFSATYCMSPLILTLCPFSTILMVSMVFILHSRRKILSTHFVLKVWMRG